MPLFHDQAPTLLPLLKVSYMTCGRWWGIFGICSKTWRLIRRGMGRVRATIHSPCARHYSLVMVLSGRYISSDEIETWCGMNLLSECGMVHLRLRKLVQGTSIVTRSSSEVTKGRRIWLFHLGRYMLQ
jgi:hypothetical protein